MSSVAAVIGNFEGARFLPDLLRTLASQTQHVVETIVADASSVDDSVAIAEAGGARTVVAPNLGLGYLYNRGVEATDADYVLLLNNDVALAADCVEQLALALDADTGRFSADPRQLDWTGERTIHARTTLSRGHLLHEYFPGLHLDPNVAADHTVPTVSSHGAAMLVRRSQFQQLRGFDETFFMEWEDLDLCWRAWMRDWESVYVPTAVVRHRVGGVTTPSVASKRSASSHHNLIRFALKCLPPKQAAIVVFGELVRLPVHGRAITAGLAVSCRELSDIRRSAAPRAVRQRTFRRLTSFPAVDPAC